MSEETLFWNSKQISISGVLVIQTFWCSDLDIVIKTVHFTLVNIKSTQVRNNFVSVLLFNYLSKVSNVCEIFLLIKTKFTIFLKIVQQL